MNGIELFNKVVSGALAIPGVNVNRDEYLKEILNPFVTEEQLNQALVKNPVAVFDEKMLDKLADDVISFHTKVVTGTSAAAGIPGGWSMAATIPADMAQYYYHVLVASQKLAYIYGWPSLLNEKGEITDGAKDIMILFMGVMSGVAAANQGINVAAKNLAEQVAKRLPKVALTKTLIYPLVKEVAKWFGKSMTKKAFAQGVSKAIPFIGAAVSGVFTYAAFKPGIKRVKNQLKEKSELFKDAPASFDKAEEINL